MNPKRCNRIHNDYHGVQKQRQYDNSTGATSALLSFLDDISKKKADMSDEGFYLANIAKNILPD